MKTLTKTTRTNNRIKVTYFAGRLFANFDD